MKQDLEYQVVVPDRLREPARLAAVRQASGAAYAAKLQGIGACVILRGNNHRLLHSLAQFKIPDLHPEIGKKVNVRVISLPRCRVEIFTECTGRWNHEKAIIDLHRGSSDGWTGCHDGSSEHSIMDRSGSGANSAARTRRASADQGYRPRSAIEACNEDNSCVTSLVMHSL